MGELVPDDDLPVTSKLVPPEDMPAAAPSFMQGVGERAGNFIRSLLPPTSSPVGMLADVATSGGYGSVAPKYGGIYTEQYARPAMDPGESGADYLKRTGLPPSQIAQGMGMAGLVSGTPIKGPAPVNTSLIPQVIKDWLEKQSIAKGQKVLLGGANPLSVKLPPSPAAVQAAYDVGAIKPFRGIAHAAEVLEGARESLGKTYGEIVDKLEAAGVKGPNALALAKQLRAKADDLEANSVATGAPELYRKIADEIESRPAMHSPQGPGTPELGLSQAENIKRSLQEKARYDRVQGDTIMEGARKNIAATVRQGVEDAVAAQQAAAPDLAAQFVPTKQRLGEIIEASEAANKGAAQAARRNSLGLTDRMAGTSAGGAVLAATGSPLAAAQAAAGATAVSKTLNATVSPTVGYIANRLSRSTSAPRGTISGMFSGGSQLPAPQFPLRIPGAAAGEQASTDSPGSQETGRTGLGPSSAPYNFTINITGADQPPADHFVRWMTDPSYPAKAKGSP